MVTRRQALTTAAILPFATATVSCTTLERWLSNPAIAAGIQDAFDVAVGVIFPQLGPNAIAVANQVLAVIGQLIALAQKNATTVGSLGTDAVNLINASALDAPIKAALVNVVGFASGILAVEVSTIPAQASGELVTVFTDIRTAVQLFVSGAQSTQGRAALTKVGVHFKE